MADRKSITYLNTWGPPCIPPTSAPTSTTTITLDDKTIEVKTNVRYLGVVLDQFLTFQDEIKSILRKTACGIKTLQSIKKPLPVKT